MSLGSLLGIVSELGSPEPSLLAFDFTVLGSPANLSAKDFKVTFGLLPLASLHRVAKFSIGELEPQTFHGGQISSGDVLYIGKVNKVAALCLGARNFNQGVTGKLLKEKEKEDDGREDRRVRLTADGYRYFRQRSHT